MLELAGIPHAELELAVAAVPFVMVDGNAVIKAQRADGQVEAETNTPVVAEIAQVVRVGLKLDVADVIEQGEADRDSMALLEDGYAVFSRAEPERIAPD